MTIAKRTLLFLAVNFLVIITISLICNLFHVQPFLQHYGLNIQSLMIFCIIWGMGGAFISLALSRQMAKWMMGVKLIDPHTQDTNATQLVNTVHQLAKAAHLTHMPEVGVFESPTPNAFATGPSKNRALVAVSSGLLRRMSHKELSGVIAHEISHIANGDMVTMTLIQGVVNAFVMFLARILAYIVSGIGRNRSNQSSGGSYMSYTLFVLLFEVVFMIFGSLVTAKFSRWREFRADRGGADLAGKDNMIAALKSLQKIEGTLDQKPKHASFQALQIASPPTRRLLSLFSTHPPLQQRIEQLQNS